MKTMLFLRGLHCYSMFLATIMHIFFMFRCGWFGAHGFRLSLSSFLLFCCFLLIIFVILALSGFRCGHCAPRAHKYHNSPPCIAVLLLLLFYYSITLTYTHSHIHRSWRGWCSRLGSLLCSRLGTGYDADARGHSFSNLI